MRSSAAVFAGAAWGLSPGAEEDVSAKARRPNFNLIQTYIPVLVICLRGAAFLVGHEQLVRLMLPAEGAAGYLSLKSLCVVSFLAVFLDQFCFMDDRFNAQALFLYPLLAMVLLRRAFDAGCLETRDCTQASYFVVTIVLDVFWSVVSNLYVVNTSMHFFKQVRLYMAASMTLCALHVVTTCFAGNLWEWVLRMVAFYVCVFLMQHLPASTARREDCENERTEVAFFVSLHLLFVHVYVLLGSVVALVGIFCRVYAGSFAPFMSGSWAARSQSAPSQSALSQSAPSQSAHFSSVQHAPAPNPAPIGKPVGLSLSALELAEEGADDDGEDLLEQLRRAKLGAV